MSSPLTHSEGTVVLPQAEKRDKTILFRTMVSLKEAIALAVHKGHLEYQHEDAGRISRDMKHQLGTTLLLSDVGIHGHDYGNGVHGELHPQYNAEMTAVSENELAA